MVSGSALCLPEVLAPPHFAQYHCPYLGEDFPPTTYTLATTHHISHICQPHMKPRGSCALLPPTYIITNIRPSLIPTCHPTSPSSDEHPAPHLHPNHLTRPQRSSITNPCSEVPPARTHATDRAQTFLPRNRAQEQFVGAKPSGRSQPASQPTHPPKGQQPDSPQDMHLEREPERAQSNRRRSSEVSPPGPTIGCHPLAEIQHLSRAVGGRESHGFSAASWTWPGSG